MGKAREHEAPERVDDASAPASPPGAGTTPVSSGSGSGSGSGSDRGMRVASHEALFLESSEVRCDACGNPVGGGDDDEGFGVPGEGVYLWARGDEVRFERAPLCASCASAIGMTALARWEIEEEEG